MLPLLALWAGGWTAVPGRADAEDEQFSAAAVAAKSPVAEVVPPLEAVRKARAYVDTHPGTDFMMGSGDSMLPLYRDHTVIVLEHIAIGQFQAGMTVVFVGDQGFPVAHVLVRRASGGWMSMGVNNTECDRSRVGEDNYIGVVVKAYQPSSSPLLALIESATAPLPVAVAPVPAVKSLVRVAPLRPLASQGHATLASNP
jgi:hypothetical protein